MPPASVASVDNCDSGQKFEFVFDRVFGLESLPGEVFDVAARDVVKRFLEGCNGSIIAYGETGSGKTDTMEGQGWVLKRKKIIVPLHLVIVATYNTTTRSIS